MTVDYPVENDVFVAKDGTRIHYSIYKPTEPPRAYVLFCHGLGEHQGRYLHVFRKFNEAGIAVKALDFRGHGLTVADPENKNGVKGHLEGLKDKTFSDLLELWALDKGQDQVGLPLFVFGHSMGGLIALLFSLDKASELGAVFKGVVSSAPAVAPYSAPPWAKLGSKLLGGVLPRVQQDNALKLEYLSRDPAVIQAYVADPLNHKFITLGTAKDLFEGGEEIIKRANEFALPLLSIHGTCDRFTSLPANEKFYGLAASTDKVFRKVEAAYHELHNEPSPVKDEVIQFYVTWFNDRIKARL